MRRTHTPKERSRAPSDRRPAAVIGETVTALGLGGVCWNLADDDDAVVAVVHRAIDLGVTYLDTAFKYKDSERRLDLALKYRDFDGLFLATKCMERSGDAVRQEIAANFEHVGVERIDRPDAAPRHRRGRTTIPAARARGMGIMAMKVMAYGQVPAADRGLFLRYAMGLDLDVAVVGMDTVEQVEENVALAEAYDAAEPRRGERASSTSPGQVAAGDKGKLFWLPETRAAG